MKIKYLLRIFLLISFVFSYGVGQRKLNEPEKTVLKFYRWYLQNVYLKTSVESPEVILTQDSVYQIDATKHIKFLNESGYFSSQFYQNEVPKFSACNKCLKNIPFQKIESVQFLSSYVEDHYCDFLDYMVWTGGQGERLNTVNILKSKVSGNIAKVFAVIGDSVSGPFSYPSVTLMRERNKWKISRLEISYEKPK